MAVYNGPPRAGSRGGRDQFNWDEVKSDKDREYYLGHSVKALTGRWQKGKDVYWYTREERKDGAKGSLDDELRAVKAHEEQLMAEALGIKPKASHAQHSRLDQQDMKRLLHRDGGDAATEGDGDAHGKGLGYHPRAMGGVSASTRLDGYDEMPAARPPSPSGGKQADDALEQAADSPRRSHKRHRHRSSSPEERGDRKAHKRHREHGEKKKKHKHKRDKDKKSKSQKEHKVHKERRHRHKDD